MKKFTFSDLNRLSGEILETAMVEPVSLTKRGKAKVVMLSAQRYERLVGKSARTAHRTAHAPDEHLDLLEAYMKDRTDG